MHKIRISGIDAKAHSQQGFDSAGCFSCACNDACCAFGADVDKEAYNLIFSKRAEIEKLIGIKLEDCFSRKWSGDSEFLGGNSIRSKVKNRICAFHLPGKKGCVLFLLAEKGIADRRLIPSICRLYPLSWDKGKIYVCADIEANCNCLQINNILKDNSIFKRQKKELDDIFEMKH
jgi:Fe-S-cluster containining protein